MLGTSKNVRSWGADTAEILSQIVSQPSPFKIILKIKDDPYFLERWIRHHSAIVGINNLIIFDNMSSLDEMFDIYGRYADNLLVVQFSGFHNRLHRTHEFPELYEGLQKACNYVAFLDSDEYLVHIGPDYCVRTGKFVLDTLLSLNTSVIPGSWLENVAGYEDRFWYDIGQNHAVAGLRSGKPIISTSALVSGMINHNRQIDVSIYDRNVVLNFFVLHLKRLSPEQRIESNYRKLHAYNAFKRKLTIDEVLQLNPDDFPQGNKRNWIREIQQFAKLRGEKFDRDAPLVNGTVLINNHDFLVFSNAEQRSVFDTFLSQPYEQLRYLKD